MCDNLRRGECKIIYLDGVRHKLSVTSNQDSHCLSMSCPYHRGSGLPCCVSLQAKLLTRSEQLAIFCLWPQPKVAGRDMCVCYNYNVARVCKNRHTGFARRGVTYDGTQ